MKNLFICCILFTVLSKKTFAFDWVGESRVKRETEQCPCVVGPNSKKCFAYNPRTQAATLQEAMLNFPDLTNPDQQNEDKDQIKAGSLQCKTDECVACAAKMVRRMVKMGLIDKSSRSVLLKRVNPGNRRTTGKCKRMKNKQRRDRPNKHTKEAEQFRQCFAKLPKPHFLTKHGKGKGDRGHKKPMPGNDRRLREQRRQPQPPMGRNGGSRKQGGQRHPGRGSRPPGGGRNPRGFIDQSIASVKNFVNRLRNKRETIDASKLTVTNYEDGSKGWNISCVNRGDPDRDQSDQDTAETILCNMCWSWRQLPDSYFPRFINELVCTSDDHCLSGHGQCHQRQQSVNVLRNVGSINKPHWSPTTVSTNTCCDCKVPYGSSLHAFISE